VPRLSNMRVLVMVVIVLAPVGSQARVRKVIGRTGRVSHL